MPPVDEGPHPDTLLADRDDPADRQTGRKDPAVPGGHHPVPGLYFDPEHSFSRVSHCASLSPGAAGSDDSLYLTLLNKDAHQPVSVDIRIRDWQPKANIEVIVTLWRCLLLLQLLLFLLRSRRGDAALLSSASIMMLSSISMEASCCCEVVILVLMCILLSCNG